MPPVEGSLAWRPVAWRRVTGIGLAGVALTALGVGLAGRRVRMREAPALDAELVPPDDVDHVRLRTGDGGSLHVAMTGDGPPVVLLHGITLQWWVWSAVIRRLRTRHRVIAWDMRGHGESHPGDRGVSLTAASDDLALMLDHLDVRDAVVVGHSMGGMCLGRFAVDHHALLHERLRGAVFLATSAAPVGLPRPWGGAAAYSGRIAARAERALVAGERLLYRWPDTNLSIVLLRAAFGARPTARMVEDTRRMLSEVAPRTIAEGWATISRHDVREELRKLDVPTVAMTGDRDLLTPVAHAHGIVDVVPGAELWVLRGVGHQVMQEDPDAVVRAVERLAPDRTEVHP